MARTIPGIFVNARVQPKDVVDPKAEGAVGAISKLLDSSDSRKKRWIVPVLCLNAPPRGLAFGNISQADRSK